MLIQEIIGAFTGQNRRDRNRNITVGIVAGLLTGAAAALLLAPQSGEETRRSIADGASKGADAVKRTALDVADKTRTKAEEVGAAVTDTYHYFREKAGDVGDDAAREARQAARKARQAARHTKDGLENIVEDVKDESRETVEKVKEDL